MRATAQADIETHIGCAKRAQMGHGWGRTRRSADGRTDERDDLDTIRRGGRDGTGLDGRRTAGGRNRESELTSIVPGVRGDVVLVVRVHTDSV